MPGIASAVKIKDVPMQQIVSIRRAATPADEQHHNPALLGLEDYTTQLGAQPYLMPRDHQQLAQGMPT